MIDIYTDVNGILTADPRFVEEAKHLPVVSYSEICNLARQGAKVIHPRAVEIAQQARVPLRVRSTYSEDTGTLVTDHASAKATSFYGRSPCHWNHIRIRYYSNIG